ncbi:MAG: manganese catalase family protein [Clostridia bacterium]|nr:manganese catalase family protein [Clostridia bacterium]
MMERIQLQTQATGEYPTTHGLTKDIRLADMIAEVYAGRYSEMTAVMRYSFQHTVSELNPSYRMLADALRGIAVSEMNHLSRLGNLIGALGRVPVYANAKGQPFSAMSVDFESDAKRFLQNDIDGEYLAIDDYEYLIAHCDNEQVNAVIRRIVEDEKVHILTLNELLGALK